MLLSSALFNKTHPAALITACGFWPLRKLIVPFTDFHRSVIERDHGSDVVAYSTLIEGEKINNNGKIARAVGIGTLPINNPPQLFNSNMQCIFAAVESTPDLANGLKWACLSTLKKAYYQKPK